jgi:hypothetical protein
MPSGREDRQRDDLQALRIVHEKTLDERGQCTRQLAWAHSELQRRQNQPQSQPQDTLEAWQLEEELKALRSELSQAKSDRDRHKSELQQARQRARDCENAEEDLKGKRVLAEQRRELAQVSALLNEVRTERDDLKAELQEARQKQPEQKPEELEQLQAELRNLWEQLRPQEAMLQKLQKELKVAQDLLVAKDAILLQLQKELRAARNQLAEKAEASKVSERDSSVAPNVQPAEASLSEAQKQAYESQLLAMAKEKLALEKALSGYSSFMNRISNSSARPVLDSVLELSTAELLGNGEYGYVMTCSSKDSSEKVLLKLQDVRWLDAAVREWTHGDEVGGHAHIVQQKELFLHSDSDKAIQDQIVSKLSAQQPRCLPSTYICTVTEYMDRGSVASLMQKSVLTLEGVCAIARQVAFALSFMHTKSRRHADIRPENILLKRAADDEILHVKLADVGSGEHAVENSRDCELLAYTLWCMILGREFSCCPSKEERTDAMAEFQKAPMLGCVATARSTALIETVFGLWNGPMEMSLVACRTEFAGCEVQDPEDDEVRRHLLACASSQVTHRADPL